jgi:hypothetical protein
MKDFPFPARPGFDFSQLDHSLLEPLKPALSSRSHLLLYTPYQPGTDRRPETEHASEIVQPPC